MNAPDSLATALPGGLVLLGPVGAAYCERALRLTQRAAVRDGVSSRPQVRALVELLAAAVAAPATPVTSGSGSAEVPEEATPSPSEAVGSEVAAEHLGITARGVRDLCSRGSLSAARVGGRWVIDRADLLAYADERRRSRTMHEYTNPPMREAARAHPPAPAPASVEGEPDPAKIREVLGLRPDATDRQVRAAFDTTMRDVEGRQFIDAAIRASKFAPARRGHYENLWAADPDGTKALIDRLTPMPTDPAEYQRTLAEELESADTYEAMYPSQA